MKIFIILNCLIVVSLATPTTLDLHSKWTEFKLTHSKTYEDNEEEQKRFGIFTDNLKKIEEHNKLHEQGLVTYRMGVNHFADLTHEEFVSSLGKSQQQQQPKINYAGKFVKPLNAHLPEAVDWRNKSVVTMAKNQRNCSASWAFAVTGALESLIAMKNGTLVSLSEEELIECALALDMFGCNGANVESAYEYVIANGLTSETAYPYTAQDGLECLNDGTERIVYAHSYYSVEDADKDEDILAHALAKVGPIVVQLDLQSCQFYADGIYTGYCTSNNFQATDYGLLVGYGTENGDQDYWIVKNSWSKYWGENGYIRLPRYQNKCCIAQSPTYLAL